MFSAKLPNPPLLIGRNWPHLFVLLYFYRFMGYEKSDHGVITDLWQRQKFGELPRTEISKLAQVAGPPSKTTVLLTPTTLAYLVRAVLETTTPILVTEVMDLVGWMPH